MGQRVKRFKTQVSESEMASAIIRVWQSLFGEQPTKEQVSLLMAHIDLETGHRQSMWNYNVGNITTDGSHNYFDDLTTNEQMSPGKWEKKNLKYKAYNNLDEGVKNYLSMISKDTGRYYKAWQHILNPNPEEYSKALKSAKYYTANEPEYTKILKSLYNKRTKTSPTDFSSSSEIAKKDPKLRKNIDSILEKEEVDLSDQEIDQVISALDEDDLENLSESKLLEISENKDDLESSINELLNELKKIKANKTNNHINRPHNNIFTIKLSSNNVNNSIECANILCFALDEELKSKSFTHTDGNDVEVECNIIGPENLCVEAVKEITDAVINSFYTVTKKIGHATINAELKVNSYSCYPTINIKTALINHRKFLLKFI